MVLSGRVGVPGIELTHFSTKPKERNVSVHIHTGTRPKCRPGIGWTIEAVLGCEVREATPK